MFGRDQRRLEDDAQIGDQRVGQIAGKTFMQGVDGTHLFAPNLTCLACVPGGHRPVANRRGARLGPARRLHHGIDLFLVENLFHG